MKIIILFTFIISLPLAAKVGAKLRCKLIINKELQLLGFGSLEQLKSTVSYIEDMPDPRGVLESVPYFSSIGTEMWINKDIGQIRITILNPLRGHTSKIVNFDNNCKVESVGFTTGTENSAVKIDPEICAYFAKNRNDWYGTKAVNDFKKLMLDIMTRGLKINLHFNHCLNGGILKKLANLCDMYKKEGLLKKYETPVITQKIDSKKNHTKEK